MSIEENTTQENEIPKFNAEAFLAEDNDVSVGNKINIVENPNGEESQVPENGEEVQTKGNEGKVEGEEKKEKDLSWDDDFLEATKNTKEEPKEIPNEELEIIAKNLGIEIKNAEDLENLKAKLNGDTKVENKKESTYDDLNLPEEELTQLNNFDNALSALDNSSNEDLMKWHLKNTNPDKYEDNDDELEYQVESLKEAGLLDDQVSLLKDKIKKEIETEKTSILEKAQNSIQAQKIENSKSLESELKKYKEGFHGISFTPSQLLDVFSDVSNNKVFNEIESSQANVAEMALLWKSRELFYKAMENPSASPGIKKFMNKLQNTKVETRSGKETLKSPYAFDPEAFLAAEDIKVVS